MTEAKGVEEEKRALKRKQLSEELSNYKPSLSTQGSGRLPSFSTQGSEWVGDEDEDERADHNIQVCL